MTTEHEQTSEHLKEPEAEAPKEDKDQHKEAEKKEDAETEHPKAAAGLEKETD